MISLLPPIAKKAPDTGDDPLSDHFINPIHCATALMNLKFQLEIEKALRDVLASVKYLPVTQSNTKTGRQVLP